MNLAVPFHTFLSFRQPTYTHIYYYLLSKLHYNDGQPVTVRVDFCGGGDFQVFTIVKCGYYGF